MSNKLANSRNESSRQKNDEFQIITDFKAFWGSLNYHCLKISCVWFLDTGTISFGFDDIMMAMTLFVLFGDSIKLMTTAKTADYPFEAVNTICLFFFIFELVANTWSKTIIHQFWPFKYEGYIFTFFWYLDIIAIVSMFPDIKWIADGLGIGNVTNAVSGSNNYTKAGRVIRLVRLVRLVKLYKIASER